MKIGLISLDGYKNPNLALCKISAYHKKLGDEVVFVKGSLVLKERNYMSCIFSWNRGREKLFPKSENIIRGGYWLDKTMELPEEIDNIMPDYGLYNMDYSFGYTSRGCPNKCSFCIVHRKEGDIRLASSIYSFWDKKHDWIRLLDNNFLAALNWKETLLDIQKEGLKVDFWQGLDIRLVREENAYYLSKVKIEPNIRFSFDSIRIMDQVEEGLNILKRRDFKTIFFYVLLGLEDRESDFERVKFLINYGDINGLQIKVYPMIYRGEDGKLSNPKGKRYSRKEIDDIKIHVHGPRIGTYRLWNWLTRD